MVNAEGCFFGNDSGKLGVVGMVRCALAFPFREGGERSETEEGYKVGIIDVLVEKV